MFFCVGRLNQTHMCYQKNTRNQPTRNFWKFNSSSEIVLPKGRTSLPNYQLFKGYVGFRDCKWAEIPHDFSKFMIEKLWFPFFPYVDDHPG